MIGRRRRARRRAVAASITYKGHGHVYDSGETNDLSMSYANVDGGSAPAAGDLVVWLMLAGDPSGVTPILDLTGSGWAQARSYVDTFLGSTILAKVVNAGDLSSPPVVVDDPVNGSIGFWIAYSIDGTISVLSVPVLNGRYSGNSAPANQSVDSSALEPPNVAITIAGGGGDDGSPSTAISGATADITFTSANNQWIAGGAETRFIVNATVGGASVTVSKSDDGIYNHLASGYVSVAF